MKKKFLIMFLIASVSISTLSFAEAKNSEKSEKNNTVTEFKSKDEKNNPKKDDVQESKKDLNTEEKKKEDKIEKQENESDKLREEKEAKKDQENQTSNEDESNDEKEKPKPDAEVKDKDKPTKPNNEVKDKSPDVVKTKGVSEAAKEKTANIKMIKSEIQSLKNSINEKNKIIKEYSNKIKSGELALPEEKLSELETSLVVLKSYLNTPRNNEKSNIENDIDKIKTTQGNGALEAFDSIISKFNNTLELYKNIDSKLDEIILFLEENLPN